MAWDGYFTYAGQEFINVSRTEKYAEGANWFRPAYNNDMVGAMLGETYVSAMIDDAPWADPNISASYDFFGFYPLEITGLEDSTATSVVQESTSDGGTPGRIRRSTKTVVFGGVLLAASEAGANYGVRWLRSLLIGSACGNLSTQTCNGDDLCYFSSEPMFADDASATAVYDVVYDGGDAFGTGPDVLFGISGYDDIVDGCDADGGCVTASAGSTGPMDCLEPYRRSLRQVVFNNGPTINSKRPTSDGGAVWYVSITGVAGNPYEFGPEVGVVAGFMDPAISDPYAAGLSGVIDLDGFIYTGPDPISVLGESCGVEVYQPVYDPLCPAIVIPPGPPSVPLGCYVPPVNWRRRQFTIPEELIPLWGEVVPNIRVHHATEDVRNLRLRFYADVNGDGSIADDPCAFCGDIVISYVPADQTLVFDGSDQVVYVESPGGTRRRADNLVFDTDGKPFTWPALTCGFGYIVTVDLPQTQAPPSMDLSLFSRVV